MDKKETFIAAIKNNEGLIYKVASIYTHTVEDKNDLVQEIIYQLWRSFDSFQKKSSITTWMYRVAMNVAIHHLKVAKRKVQTVPLEDTLLQVQETATYELEEKWQWLRAQLDTLNLLDKGIVMLYLEDKSHEEIAQIIGITVSNVGTRLSRIKERLKNTASKTK